MASLEETTKVVEKVVETTEPEFVLRLTRDEAQYLRSLTGAAPATELNNSIFRELHKKFPGRVWPNGSSAVSVTFASWLD